MRFLRLFVLIFILIFSFDGFARLPSASEYTQQGGGHSDPPAPFSEGGNYWERAQDEAHNLSERERIPIDEAERRIYRRDDPEHLSTAERVMMAFTNINNGCWFCKIHRILLQTINDFTAQLSEPLSRYAIALLALGLGFFILLKILKALFSFGEIDPKQFLTELFKPFVMTILAIIVIMNLSSFYEYIVTPLTKLSIGFATEINETSGVRFSRLRYSAYYSGRIDIPATPSETPGCSCGERDDDCTAVTLTNGIGLSNEVNQSIQCFLRQISLSLIVYIATGATFIMNCWQSTFPNWTMLGVGLCVAIGCFSIFISFPLRLLDAIIRLMFVCALMPFWVILWVLPATRDKSIAAFNMFLGAMFTFVCLSVIMLMVIQILNSVIGLQPDQYDLFFNTYLLNGQTNQALAMLDWGNSAFFTCLSMTFLALSLTKKAESFASQFAQASSLGVGSSLEYWTMAAAALPMNKVVRPMVNKGLTKLGKALGKKTTYHTSS